MHESTPTDRAGGQTQPLMTSDERGVVAVDDALLDQAVEQINRIATAKGLETARALGEYVVATFFGGNTTRAAEQRETHATWRALADRADLRISHSNLWSSVAILEQLRKLPEDIGNALPVSHHRRLLTMKDDDLKVRLAERAVKEQLTVQQLEEAVAEGRQRNGRGRKPLPVYVKALRAVEKQLQRVAIRDISGKTIGGGRKAKALLESIDAQLEKLQSLRLRVAELAEADE